MFIYASDCQSFSLPQFYAIWWFPTPTHHSLWVLLWGLVDCAIPRRPLWMRRGELPVPSGGRREEGGERESKSMCKDEWSKRKSRKQSICFSLHVHNTHIVGLPNPILSSCEKEHYKNENSLHELRLQLSREETQRQTEDLSSIAVRVVTQLKLFSNLFPNYGKKNLKGSKPRWCFVSQTKHYIRFQTFSDYHISLKPSLKKSLANMHQ